VVLATGAFDRPNLLRVPGETVHPYILHSLAELEDRCNIEEEEGSLGVDSDPVIVIGAGLCAADAVLYLAGREVPVVRTLHLFTHIY